MRDGIEQEFDLNEQIMAAILAEDTAMMAVVDYIKSHGSDQLKTLLVDWLNASSHSKQLALQEYHLSESQKELLEADLADANSEAISP